MNIKVVDISTLSYEELDSKFYHFSSADNFESINAYGLRARIGKNSEGLDTLVSIFFSKGIEGLLETWDVWLRWRLDRLFNPYYMAKYRDVKVGTPLYKEYKVDEDAWYKEFINKEYLFDKDKLEKLYAYQADELENSFYYILNLKENVHFSYNQVDLKKKRSIERGNFTNLRAFYGDYSLLNSTLVDKWNMQTFPGKDINLSFDEFSMINVNGKYDDLSILNYFYNLYINRYPDKKNSHFELLDNFISYINNDKQYSK